MPLAGLRGWTRLPRLDGTSVRDLDRRVLEAGIAHLH